MSWRGGVSVQLHLLAALVVLALGVYAVRNRRAPGARSLAVLLFTVGAWATGHALMLAASDFATKQLLAQLTFVPVSFVPVLWFAFIVRYAGHRHSVPRVVFMGLAIVSGGFALAGLTNPVHGLVWQSFEMIPSARFPFRVEQYGPLYTASLVYSYVLVAGGAAIVVRLLVSGDSFQRGQAVALLVAIAIPVAANVAYLLGVIEAGVDPSVVSVTVSGIVFWWAVYRHRLLTLTPITTDVTRDEFIDRMTTPVIAVNGRTEIVEVNPAALDLFGGSRSTVVGHQLSTVAPNLAGLVERYVPDVTGHQVYRQHTDGVHRTYDVSVEPLSWEGGTTTGRLVSLHDVTERRRREEHLRVLHRLLRHNLRNDLNVVMGHASDLSEYADAPAVGSRAAVIERTATRLADQADKLGRVIHEVDTETTHTVDVGELLANVVDDARSTHRAAIALDSSHSAHVVAGPVLRLAFAELVENAIVHNENFVPHIDVSVEPVEDEPSVVAVSVADDGPGIPDFEVEALQLGEEAPLEHTTGVGLWVVSWAVRRYGGRFVFDVDDTGTTVRVVLPRATSN